MNIHAYDAARTLVNEMRVNVLAVDIGNNGGMVGNEGNCLVIRPMPQHTKDQWAEFRSFHPRAVYAENVHTFAGQGIVSQGTLLKNRGRIEGYAAAYGADIQWIEPLKWIEKFTLQRRKHFTDIKKWKKHLLETAKEIADEETLSYLTLETCDAYMMWIYAASIVAGKPLKPIGFTLA